MPPMSPGYWQPEVVQSQLQHLYVELGQELRVGDRLRREVAGLVDRLVGLGVPTPALAGRFEDRPTWSE